MRGLVKAFGYLLVPKARQFHRALQHPQQAQATLQQHLIEQLRHSEYGQKFQIRDRKDWHRLPIVSYEDLQPWIDRPSGISAAPSKKHYSGLTPETVLFYEPTSGSSGPIKQIPYTRSLRRSFSHMFCIWAHDLIARGPAFSTGQFYFSISPTFSQASAAGTADDSEYLSPWLRWLLSPFWVVSPPAKTPAGR